MVEALTELVIMVDVREYTREGIIQELKGGKDG